jgi:hypothetical protein
MYLHIDPILLFMIIRESSSEIMKNWCESRKNEAHKITRDAASYRSLTHGFIVGRAPTPDQCINQDFMHKNGKSTLSPSASSG